MSVFLVVSGMIVLVGQECVCVCVCVCIGGVCVCLQSYTESRGGIFWSASIDFVIL